MFLLFLSKILPSTHFCTIKSNEVNGQLWKKVSTVIVMYLSIL